jgi:hypothetical protein
MRSYREYPARVRLKEHVMNNDKSNYGRFFAMVGTSTAIMLVLMYLNTFELSHVKWSETRFYMTFVMGATMAIVMLAFMLGMYKNKTVNLAIFAGSAVVFAASLWLVRSQTTVEDESWMRAMIPHHSIAILTSERAGIDDVRVQELANEIIKAQRREIKEMEWLLDDIAKNGEALTEEAAKARPVPTFDADA